MTWKDPDWRGDVSDTRRISPIAHAFSDGYAELAACGFRCRRFGGKFEGQRRCTHCERVVRRVRGES